MGTNIILLFVIVGVLVIDFIFNSRKKSSIDEAINRIEKKKPIKSKNLIRYLLNRKRNFLSFIFLVFLLKTLIHFTIYPDQEEFINYNKQIIWDIGLVDSLSWEDQDKFYDFGGPIVVGKRGETLVRENIDGNSLGRRGYKYFYYPKEDRSLSLSKHLELMFKSKLWIFLVSLGTMGIIVSLFNDKIKAR